jgi:hypothetical protein
MLLAGISARCGAPEFASQSGLRPVEAKRGVEVEIVAGLQSEEAGD